MLKDRVKPDAGLTPLNGVGVETYQEPYRWVILILLWLLYFSFGLVYRSIAPLVTPILRDLGISYTQMGFILGSWPLIYIMAAVAAGVIIDKWGIRKSLLLGVVIMGLSAILRYFANGFVTMLLIVALFGVGGPMISVGCPKAISLWFKGKGRATAVGIYMTGTWTGGLLGLSLTNSLVMPLTGYSWRLTFVIYGVLTFLIALLWWFLAKDPRQTTSADDANIWEVFSALIKVRNVQVALMIGLLCFASFHGFTNWLPKMLEASGLSPDVAGFMASIPLATSIPAVLFIPRSVPQHLRGRFIAFFALLSAAAVVAVVTASDVLQIAALILIGLTGFCFSALTILILMDTPEVESRYMGSAGGMYFCVAEIGGFTGPLVVGVLLDSTGNFMMGMSFLSALYVAAFSMTFLLKIRQVPDQKVQ